jgi:predicted choloylglycine hydrolase
MKGRITMTMEEKIKEELLQIKYEKKNLMERFENAKKDIVEIYQKANPQMVCELEEKYQVFTDIKRYAYQIEILNAKLRVFDYLTDENR